MKISLVIPCYNEEATVETFYGAATTVLNEIEDLSYEMIFVNDGSRDSTRQKLKELAEKDERVKVVNFSRNFGQQAAILCGFRVCTGDCAVELDCDLQDPVEIIPKMIEKWKEGYDVVHGRRIARKGETFFKKATASYYYKKLAKVSSIDLPRNTGDFKLLDRRVVDIIINLPEHNKYLRGLESWVGFKQTFVDYERNERIAGETHYTMKKMINLAKAGLISNSFYPLSFSLKFGVFGGVLSVLGYIALIFLAAFGVINGPVWWLFPTITLLFSGLAVFNGLTNLYIEKIYDEVKNRPEYIIDDKINLEN